MAIKATFTDIVTIKINMVILKEPSKSFFIFRPLFRDGCMFYSSFALGF